jgi:hypothetical protein
MSDTIEDSTELRLWSLEKIKENKAKVARAYNKKVRPKEFQVGDLVCVFLDLDLESVDLPAATVAMLISLPRSTMMDFFVDGRITTVASMGMGMRYEILRPPPPPPPTHTMYFSIVLGVSVLLV